MIESRCLSRVAAALSLQGKCYGVRSMCVAALTPSHDGAAWRTWSPACAESTIAAVFTTYRLAGLCQGPRYARAAML